MNTNSVTTNVTYRNQQSTTSCCNDQSKCSDTNNQELIAEIFELIRDIKDPELPQTLEELNVVNEDEIFVRNRKGGEACICINFTPTVPHCSLATLIGLCIRIKLQRCLSWDYKLDIYVTKGSHSIEDDVNKQINDKERVAAAMENPNLKKIVEECLQEVQY